MSRQITFTATIPDDTDDLEMDGRSFEYEVRAEGVDPEFVPAILLAGVEAFVRQTIRQEMEVENPMGNSDFMDQVAALEARIMILDMTVHLPDRGQDGIVTQIA
jgi:hypothetical protein